MKTADRFRTRRRKFAQFDRERKRSRSDTLELDIALIGHRVVFGNGDSFYEIQYHQGLYTAVSRTKCRRTADTGYNERKRVAQSTRIFSDPPPGQPPQQFSPPSPQRPATTTAVRVPSGVEREPQHPET
ncbi:hypothetical protein Tcan_04855 [Toxocara canis]|uniref:Uncharacterized protein n=1 Tax=Toxocara canis TaxID=6265 RepID=A0A0B2VEH6_TOXCA|nr:hypothetical protein Tcan_04855 [Toxocara canis]